jgi:hypothetical protein
MWHDDVRRMYSPDTHEFLPGFRYGSGHNKPRASAANRSPSPPPPRVPNPGARPPSHPPGGCVEWVAGLLPPTLPARQPGVHNAVLQRCAQPRGTDDCVFGLAGPQWDGCCYFQVRLALLYEWPAMWVRPISLCLWISFLTVWPAIGCGLLEWNPGSREGGRWVLGWGLWTDAGLYCLY